MCIDSKTCWYTLITHFKKFSKCVDFVSKTHFGIFFKVRNLNFKVRCHTRSLATARSWVTVPKLSLISIFQLYFMDSNVQRSTLLVILTFINRENLWIYSVSGCFHRRFGITKCSDVVFEKWDFKDFSLYIIYVVYQYTSILLPLYPICDQNVYFGIKILKFL